MKYLINFFVPSLSTYGTSNPPEKGGGEDIYVLRLPHNLEDAANIKPTQCHKIKCTFSRSWPAGTLNRGDDKRVDNLSEVAFFQIRQRFGTYVSPVVAKPEKAESIRDQLSKQTFVISLIGCEVIKGTEVFASGPRKFY